MNNKIFKLNFSPQTIDNISTAMHEKFFKKGDNLFLEDQHVNTLNILVKGNV